jgi:hypothetical protein
MKPLRTHFADNHVGEKAFMCEFPNCTYSSNSRDSVVYHGLLHPDIVKYRQKQQYLAHLEAKKLKKAKILEAKNEGSEDKSSEHKGSEVKITKAKAWEKRWQTIPKQQRQKLAFQSWLQTTSTPKPSTSTTM